MLMTTIKVNQRWWRNFNQSQIPILYLIWWYKFDPTLIILNLILNLKLKLVTDGVETNIIIKSTGETPKAKKEETNVLPIFIEYDVEFVGDEQRKA